MSRSGLPSFISIGAQKCATTWLYNCMKQHPDIFVGPKNRVIYFEEPQHSQRDPAWYRTFFAAAADRQVIGDFRVEYVYNKETPALVAAELPDCRFIVNFRDPVTRAVSAYLWNIRRGLLPNRPLDHGIGAAIARDFEGLDHAQARILDRLVDMGRYADQLERWLNHFEIDRFLVLLTDDIKRNPQRCVAAAFEFIGVDPTFCPRGLASRPLASAGLPWLTALERVSTPIYGSFKVWNLANRMALQLVGRGRRPSLSTTNTRALLDLYRPYNHRLRALLERYRKHPGTLSEHLILEDCSWL